MKLSTTLSLFTSKRTQHSVIAFKNRIAKSVLICVLYQLQILMKKVRITLHVLLQIAS